jgi:hypothetical protein
MSTVIIAFFWGVPAFHADHDCHAQTIAIPLYCTSTPNYHLATELALVNSQAARV